MGAPVFRILIADTVSPKCRELFADDSRFQVVEQKLRGDDLLEGISQFDALIVRSGCKVTAEVLARASRLKVVVRAGVGVDNIDISEATRRGVLVMNTPEGNTIAAAEHTVAMMLAVSRNIARADARIREGGWRGAELMGNELRGKTVGVVGLGKIGRQVLERLRAFEIKAIGFDPVLTAEMAADIGVELVSIDELFSRADLITLHVPLTPKTKDLVNAETFKRMKKGARIVNCSRGGVINEADLVQALESGEIAGAALDVFEKEPLPANHPLTKVPNIVLTPHLGASTEEAQVNVGTMAGHQIRAYLLNDEIRNAINTIASSAYELELLEPYVYLARQLGSLHAQLLKGNLKRVVIRFAGTLFESEKDRASRCQLLTLSVLEGFFQHYLDAPVNRVSVPHFAREHGLEIEENQVSDARGFSNLLTIVVENAEEKRTLSGTLFGEKPRLVYFDEHDLDAPPEGRVLIFKNNDEPGMLGRVSTLLGDAGVNISNVALGRVEGGDSALAYMNIDSELSPQSLASLNDIKGINWVRVVDLSR